MPQLLKLRFVSLGHPQARMDDLVLRFEGADGRATDSTLWLRNGGGKSSILNLFFALVRPHKGEFLGGKAEARQRSLDDYILSGDRAVVAAEWELDPATESLGLESERFLTGVFYERREGSGELRRLFFATRVAAQHAESTLDGLPLFATSPSGRTRRTLSAFREAWRLLRDRVPHLNVSDTENQREWHDVLEGARIDPELFSYQVRMNQREGGADELFRFAEAEQFVDFLLELALDPSLGDRVGKNIAAFRRELLQRKDQLMPERGLVSSLVDRLDPLRAVRDRRARLRSQLGEARDEVDSLEAACLDRLEALNQQLLELERARTSYVTEAEQETQQAASKRGKAAQLRRHAAELRVQRLRDEHERVQTDWHDAQRLAAIWSAAVPLRRALQFEERAREQRRMLEQRETEHAPLRDELVRDACRLAAALAWRAADHRTRATEARETERKARDEARDYRIQAVDAGKAQSSAETEAKRLEGQLAALDAQRKKLVNEELLAPDETADAAAARWTGVGDDHKTAVAKLDDDIERFDGAMESLVQSLEAANEVLRVHEGKFQGLSQRFEDASRERTAIEHDEVIKGALELESIDGDRVGDDAIGTLEHAIRATQRSILETRLAMADDERAALHLEEHGLLPPTPEAQRLVQLLAARLGGQAWSGWSWIQANVPPQEAAAAVRKAPYFAQGVVVRPSDFDRAVEIVHSAGLEPDGPMVVATTDALARAPELPGVVVGPKETGWFNRDAAGRRLLEVRERLDGYRQRLQEAETRQRSLTRACEAMRAFRTHYPVGWFENTRRELSSAEALADAAETSIEELQSSRKEKTAARKLAETARRDHERQLGTARTAAMRVRQFLDDYIRPSDTWRTDLAAERERAKRAAEDVRQWQTLADAADGRAAKASEAAGPHGEEARALEEERLKLAYVDGEIVPEAGALDDLRDRYSLLRSQYEEKVGADALLALANENTENARRERTTLAKLLTAETTEEIVRDHLTALADADAVDQTKREADEKEKSLLGKRLNLESRIAPAALALEQAEVACSAFILLGPLERAPATPELAEADASTLDGAVKTHESNSATLLGQAGDASASVDRTQQRMSEIDRVVERLCGLREDYEDLFTTAPPRTGELPPASLEESLLASRVKKLAEGLRGDRTTWQTLDRERGTAVAALRAAATAPEFEGVGSIWMRRLQEHDDSALEDESHNLSSQLELRRSVLDEQIAGIDRHRTILVDELHAVAEDGMKLLRQASNLSKLPDHVPGIGGAHFLRIQTQEPDDPTERRGRLAELIDEVLDGKHELGGLALVQSAVRKLARPIQVRVLHPDPALDRRTVSIPEMARSSGGEQLTGAILLYCTLARVRARSRGFSRRASTVLILDNPIGRASRVRFLELQREVARAMGVQLIYTTGVNDHEALRALPNIVRLRNERVDRNTGRRLVENSGDEMRSLEAVRVGRRESENPGQDE